MSSARAVEKAHEEFLDGLIIAAVSDDSDEGPDAKKEFPCPACKGGADGLITWSRVVEWRCYGRFVVQIDCDGCNFSREVDFG